MSLLVALALCAGAFIGFAAGRSAGRRDVELQMRIAVPAALGVFLFGLHTVAIAMVGSSTASGFLAAIATGILAFAVVFTVAGYLTRGAKWAGGAVSRFGKKKDADAPEPAEESSDG